MKSLPHTCHARGCRSQCPPRFLMCGRHWAMVPAATQREVYATVGKRNMRAIDKTWAPWWRAQANAINAVAQLELDCMLSGGRIEEAAYRNGEAIIERVLARELTFADTLEGRGERGLPPAALGIKVPKCD